MLLIASSNLRGVTRRWQQRLQQSPLLVRRLVERGVQDATNHPDVSHETPHSDQRDLRTRTTRRPGRSERGSRSTLRTTVGGVTIPAPHSRTCALPPPARVNSSRSRSSSSATLDPFSASMRPCSCTNGSDHCASLASGATAREVTTSAPPASFRTPGCSARPRTTVTSSPASSMNSARNIVRRSSGSTSVTRRSGRAIASGIPGSPAPLPTSTTVAPSAMSSPITAQLRMCRSHSRGSSRGPINPRSTPAPAKAA